MGSRREQGDKGRKRGKGEEGEEEDGGFNNNEIEEGKTDLKSVVAFPQRAGAPKLLTFGGYIADSLMKTIGLRKAYDGEGQGGLKGEQKTGEKEGKREERRREEDESSDSLGIAEVALPLISPYAAAVSASDNGVKGTLTFSEFEAVLFSDAVCVWGQCHY